MKLPELSLKHATGLAKPLRKLMVAAALLANLAPLTPALAAAPVADAQTVTTDKNVAVNVQLTASDPDNDPIVGYYKHFSNPTGGTVSNWNTTAGTFTFTPNTDWVGTTSVTFRVKDSTNTYSAYKVVTINVEGVNEPPVANNDPFTTQKNVALNAQLTGTDPEGNPLTFHRFTGVGVWYGTITNWNSSTGTFTYTPDTDFVGSDFVRFRVYDGAFYSSYVNVTINITGTNEPPTANDGTLTTDKNTAVNGQVTGSDPEDSTLTYFHENLLGPNHGTITNWNSTTGTYTYTPDTDFVGTDYIKFKVHDGNFWSTNPTWGTITITVNGTNEPPTANNGTLTTDKNTAVNGQATGSDPENSTLTFFHENLLGPDHGTVSNWNSSTGTFTYTPKTDYVGTDYIKFRVYDGNFWSSNPTWATITITVNGTNELPVANNQTVSVEAGQSITGTLTGTDPESSPLTFSYWSAAQPQHGDLTNFNTETGSFTYKADAGYTGSDSFQFRVYDGNFYSATRGVVTINITEPNAAPVASNLSLATASETAITSTLPATDPDGDPLTYTISTMHQPANGEITIFDSGTGQFTYVPDASFSGTDTFQFTASDGTNTSNAGTVTIDVAAANNAPVAGNDSVSTNRDTAYNDSVSATDADNDPLTYSVEVEPAHGQVSLNASTGAYTYTPDTGYFGADSFTYRANDGTSDSNLATVSITVNWVNPLPGAVSITSPIDSDGSSVFNANRGTIPVKFVVGASSCSNLPAATIALNRVEDTVSTPVNEEDWMTAVDSGVHYRTQDCQYHYNLDSDGLGEGEYEVTISIEGNVVGTAYFKMK